MFISVITIIAILKNSLQRFRGRGYPDSYLTSISRSKESKMSTKHKGEKSVVNTTPEGITSDAVSNCSIM